MGKIIYGSKEEISKKLESSVFVLSSLNEIRGSKLGLVGKPSNWLISSGLDQERLSKYFSSVIDEIPFGTLLKEIKKGEYVEDDEAKAIKSLPYDKETLEGALDIYGALGRIASKRNWKGFSIRCFDLLTSVHNTACLALGLFNSKLFTASCEGDETALLSMFILNRLGKEAFQCNPCSFDITNKKMVLDHCTAPLSMFKEKVTLMSHFESGEGVGIRGKFLLEDCTVFKLSPTLQEAYVFEGKITANLEKENLCRSQLEVKFDEDISSLLDRPFGNHLLLCYGKEKERLETLLPYLGVKIVA